MLEHVLAVDPRGAQSYSLTGAASVSGLGTAEELDLVPGVYRVSTTGPVMLCHGETASDAGVPILPDRPETVVVEGGRKLCAAAMSGACRINWHRLVRVPMDALDEVRLAPAATGARVRTLDPRERPALRSR